MAFPTVSVPFYELHTWPREKGDILKSGAVRKVKVAWKDRGQFIYELMLTANMEYPYWSTFANTSTAILTGWTAIPFPGELKKNDVWDDMADYDYALVTLHYTTDIYTDGTNFLKETLGPAHEFERLPFKEVYWDNGQANPLKRQEAGIRVTPMMDYTLTYYRLTAVPAAVFTYPSVINSDGFATKALGYTFLANTLRYNNARVTHSYVFGAATYYNVTYYFTFKPNRSTQGAHTLMGWNTEWRQDVNNGAGDYSKIYDGAGNEIKKHEPVVFTGVF